MSHFHLCTEVHIYVTLVVCMPLWQLEGVDISCYQKMRVVHIFTRRSYSLPWSIFFLIFFLLVQLHIYLECVLPVARKIQIEFSVDKWYSVV